MSDNEIRPPTEGDLKRDAAADLAACAGATPGPYRVEHMDDADGEGYYLGAGGTGPDDDVCLAYYRADDGNRLADELSARQLAQLARDFDFLATACNALPAWVRRAHAAESRAGDAEAERDRLREALEQIVAIRTREGTDYMEDALDMADIAWRALHREGP